MDGWCVDWTHFFFGFLFRNSPRLSVQCSKSVTGFLKLGFVQLDSLKTRKRGAGSVLCHTSPALCHIVQHSITRLHLLIVLLHIRHPFCQITWNRTTSMLPNNLKQEQPASWIRLYNTVCWLVQINVSLASRTFSRFFLSSFWSLILLFFCCICSFGPTF